MLILPAMDLLEGQCVRLLQGDYQKITSYGNPQSWMEKFASLDLPWMHLVDLQGAKDPAKRQWDLIQKLCSLTKTRVQCGGGIRTLEDCKELLNHGVSRVLIGSTAAREPQFVSSWIDQMGSERLGLAIDLCWDRVNPPVVKIAGWRDESPNTLEELLRTFKGIEGLWILCTDIGRDGTLQGPALDLYSLLLKEYPKFQWIASGGIRSIDDLSELKSLGCQAAVVGKALFEGHIRLDEVGQC